MLSARRSLSQDSAHTPLLHQVPDAHTHVSNKLQSTHVSATSGLVYMLGHWLPHCHYAGAGAQASHRGADFMQAPKLMLHAQCLAYATPDALWSILLMPVASYVAATALCAVPISISSMTSTHLILLPCAAREPVLSAQHPCTPKHNHACQHAVLSHQHKAGLVAQLAQRPDWLQGVSCWP